MGNIFFRVKDENGVERIFNMVFSEVYAYRDYSTDKEPTVYKVVTMQDTFKISKDTYEDIMKSLNDGSKLGRLGYADFIFNKD